MAENLKKMLIKAENRPPYLSVVDARIEYGEPNEGFTSFDMVVDSHTGEWLDIRNADGDDYKDHIYKYFEDRNEAENWLLSRMTYGIIASNQALAQAAQESAEAAKRFSDLSPAIRKLRKLTDNE